MKKITEVIVEWSMKYITRVLVSLPTVPFVACRWEQWLQFGNSAAVEEDSAAPAEMLYFRNLDNILK